MGDVKRYDHYESDEYPWWSSITEQHDGEYVLHTDYASLLARHNALVEAVAWLRAVDDTREWLSEFPWLRKWSGLDQCMNDARAEVGRLMGGE